MRALIKAVITVSSFAIISRIISFFFKIFLSNYLGASNLGVYQVATSIFFVLVAVTCTGFPLTISKQTAQYHTQLDRATALRKESKAVTACIVISIIFSLIMFGVFAIFGTKMRHLFADEQTMNVFLLILPALLAIGFISPIRSALWGRKLYTTTSILEIVEQLLRIGLCVLFVLLLDYNNLYITAWTFTVSAILTAIICLIFYYKQGGRLSNPRNQFRPLLVTGIPITATRISNSIVFMLISLAIPYLFGRMGLSTTESLYMLGSSMGMALPLLFVPNTIVGSLAYIMIPTLSQLNPNNPQMSQQINGAIKISTLVACAFVPAFYVMGQHSGLFLFNNLTTGQFLQSSAWLLIPIALESITSSMLNALDLESRGFFNYCLGSAILFVVMFCFANKFSLQVFSIAFGLALTISTILDIISIQRKTKIKLTFVYPMTICLAMVVPTIAFTSNIYNFLGALTESRLLQFVRLATTGISSVCFYIGIIYILDSIGVSTIIATKKTCKKLAKKPKIV